MGKVILRTVDQPKHSTLLTQKHAQTQTADQVGDGAKIDELIHL